MNTDELRSLTTDEVVTHSYRSRRRRCPSGKTLALDHARQRTRPHAPEHDRPSDTPSSSPECSTSRKARAGHGEIAAVAITGKPFILAAGADLSKVSEIPSREVGRQMAAARALSVRQAHGTGRAIVRLHQRARARRRPRDRPERELPHDRQLGARASPCPRCSSDSSPAGAAPGCCRT